MPMMDDPRYLHLSFLILGFIMYGPGTFFAIMHYLGM
jgi:hypothetical protein